MKAEQKSINFSSERRKEIKKMRAMSLLNRTEKKIERKKLLENSLPESGTQLESPKHQRQ